MNERMLKKAGACIEKRRLFCRLFGAAGGTVTLAKVKRAEKAGLHIGWVISRFFTDAQHEAYRADPRLKYCTRKFMQAPLFSKREAQWSDKMDTAKQEAFVRVWNEV